MGDIFGGSAAGTKDIKKSRDRALQQLQSAFEGPLKGLQQAIPFFKMLASPELANTPLGRGVGLQQELISQAMGGLQGQAFNAGKIPADMNSAVLESLGQAQAARGTYGSGTGDLELGNRFAGISEQLRTQRLHDALAVLGGTSAAGSVAPSASQWLGTSLATAQAGADVEMRSGQLLAQADMAQSQARGQLLGGVLSFGLGAGLGGFGGGGGFNLLSALRGGGAASGFLPASAFPSFGGDQGMSGRRGNPWNPAYSPFSDYGSYDWYR